MKDTLKFKKQFKNNNKEYAGHLYNVNIIPLYYSSHMSLSPFTCFRVLYNFKYFRTSVNFERAYIRVIEIKLFETIPTLKLDISYFLRDCCVFTVHYSTNSCCIKRKPLCVSPRLKSKIKYVAVGGFTRHENESRSSARGTRRGTARARIFIF